MKNLISKMTLLLLCSAFVLSSCSKDEPNKDKKTVTRVYRILVNSDQDRVVTLAGNGGIKQLFTYIDAEMDKVSEEYDVDAWEITETAATEEAAIAACDKKAVAIFDAKLSAMNAAAASIKEKFETKKAELQAAIAADKSSEYMRFSNYGAYLFKGTVDDIIIKDLVKKGTTFDFEAIGGGGK